MTSTVQPTSTLVGAASKPVVPRSVGAADLVIRVSVLLVWRVVLVLLTQVQIMTGLLLSQTFPSSTFLTSCRMVSVRTRCQSMMMLSVSYWIRNSTPFFVFNWGGHDGSLLLHPRWSEAVEGAETVAQFINKPLKRSFCWICLLWPSRSSLPSGPLWTLGQSDWFCSAGKNKNKLKVTLHKKTTCLSLYKCNVN